MLVGAIDAQPVLIRSRRRERVRDDGSGHGNTACGLSCEVLVVSFRRYRVWRQEAALQAIKRTSSPAANPTPRVGRNRPLRYRAMVAYPACSSMPPGPACAAPPPVRWRESPVLRRPTPKRSCCRYSGERRCVAAGPFPRRLPRVRGLPRFSPRRRAGGGELYAAGLPCRRQHRRPALPRSRTVGRHGPRWPRLILPTAAAPAVAVLLRP